MAETLKIPQKLVYDWLDDATVINTDTWRHGAVLTLLFERHGKHWITTIRTMPEDGWQIDEDLEAYEAVQVTNTITEWVVKE